MKFSPKDKVHSPISHMLPSADPVIKTKEILAKENEVKFTYRILEVTTNLGTY